MYAFVSKRKPLSHNAPNRDQYKRDVAADFDGQGFTRLLSGSLYARIYYFHKAPSGLDADNMSKPIVDALRNHAYPDDNVVIHRTAAIVNINRIRITELSLTHVPDDVIEDFLDALDNEPDVIYIEVGPYNHEMLHFGRNG